MPDSRVIPFRECDEEAALALERMCVQGKSLCLRYQRPSFGARSQLYENSIIYCMKESDQIIGVIAGALKSIKLHNRVIQALYVYDLRIHPDHRRKGLARTLGRALIENFGQEADCFYIFIHGQNKKAHTLACHYFSPRMVVPLTYVVFPVYKPYRINDICISTAAERVRLGYEGQKPDIEFLPRFNPSKMMGQVESFVLQKGEGGVSLWTNEDILAEQIVKVPTLLSAIRLAAVPLRLCWKLPSVPKPGQILKSLFLYDFFAGNKQSFDCLIRTANNIALERGKEYLYILLQNTDPVLDWIKQSKFRHFSFPYYFLAKGESCPRPDDQLYIDIRDL